MGKMNLDVIISYEIKDMIENEGFKEGDRLPPERELAEKFAVQRLTVRSALKILLNEGDIYVEERKGYFVAKQRIEKSLKQFESTSKALESTGVQSESELLVFEDSVVDKEIMQEFEVTIGTPIYKIIRLRKADGIPIMIESSYLLKAYVPTLTKERIDDKSLYQVLFDDYQLEMSRSEKFITIITADEKLSNYLNVPFGEPLVDQHGMVYDVLNRKIEYSRSILLIDRFVFTN